jgi:ubiquitin C-terminal hydrolase
MCNKISVYILIFRTGEVSLSDCFESFTKEEVLDGEEMPVIILISFSKF